MEKHEKNSQMAMVSSTDISVVSPGVNQRLSLKASVLPKVQHEPPELCPEMDEHSGQVVRKSKRPPLVFTGVIAPLFLILSTVSSGDWSAYS